MEIRWTELCRETLKLFRVTLIEMIQELVLRACELSALTLRFYGTLFSARTEERKKFTLLLAVI